MFSLNNFSIAPLLNYINIHSCFFYNLLLNKIPIYMGMIHTSSFIYNYKSYYNKWLNSFKNKNIILQFAGNSYKDLYKCILLIKKFKYKEINFNIGCPSLRARKSNFGFYLMKNKNIIIDCLNAIREANNNVKISLKHRLGNNNYNYLLDFVGTISLFTDCKKFIVHARNILYDNTSTYLNLKIPKINYSFVYKLKRDLSFLEIIINGDIYNLSNIYNHMINDIDGVMIGRGIYYNPLFLLEIKNFINYKNFVSNKYNNINFNNNIFYNKNNKITNYILLIFYQIFNYINLNIKYYKINNIINNIIHIFYNIKNSSLFKKRMLMSIKLWNNFKNYNDFIYFMFYDFI